MANENLTEEQIIAMNKMTSEEVADIKEKFNIFDKDGDGRITITELGEFLRSRGQSPTDDELRAIISEADTDQSGTIEFSEFLNFMARQNRGGDSEEELMAAFREFDLDGNGFISPEEVRQVMAKQGRQLMDREIDLMIAEADTDGDGQINYREFVRVMLPK